MAVPVSVPDCGLVLDGVGGSMITYANVEKDVPGDWYRLNIALDGQLIDGCIEADVDEGRVVCFVYGEDGRAVIRADGEGIERETKTGTVEIIHSDDLGAWQRAQKG